MVRDDLMKGSSKRFIVAKSRIGNLEAIIVCQRELKLGIPLAMTALSKAATKLQTRNDIVLLISTTSDKFVSESMQGVSGFTHNDHTISSKHCARPSKASDARRLLSWTMPVP